MAVKVSACPRDCYSTCSFLVSVKNGRIGLIEPHSGNRAASEGICLKGLSYPERVSHPDRLLFPLRRKGDTFTRISWEEALSTIVGKIREVKDRYGPLSILYYAATGTKGLLNSCGPAFWELTGGYTSTYGDLCWPSGLEATRLTLGENIHNTPWDIENASLVVSWGKNIAETNIHQMKFIENAREKGGKFIVIDPRRTETASRADMHISPKPGTDAALALGIGNLLIREGAIDSAAIGKYVSGFEEYKKITEGYPPGKVEQITGVPVNELKKAAALMGEIRPMTLTAGFGLQRYTNSGQTVRTLIALPVITGNIGKKGGGWVYANLQSHIFDEVNDPLAIYPRGLTGNVRNTIPVTGLADGIMDSNDPPVKMIWVERGNPVAQNPDTGNMKKAFRSLDFRVVVDQFLTDTAKEADIILPAKTMFEQSDVINAYWHHYIQLKQKVIDPPGEVKPESEIFYLLAEKLGIPEDALKGKIPGPADEEVNRFLEDKLAPFPRLSLEELRKGPVIAPGSVDIAFSENRFHTPSGKIELYSEEAEERWGVSRLPEYVAPRYLSEPEFPFLLLSTKTKNRIHSQFGNLGIINQFDDPGKVFIHPDDAAGKGISQGENVEVFNGKGKISGTAELDFSLRRNTILVKNGRWEHEGGSVNRLTSQRETDMGHGPAFYDVAVDVRRVP